MVGIFVILMNVTCLLLGLTVGYLFGTIRGLIDSLKVLVKEGYLSDKEELGCLIEEFIKEIMK